MKKILSIMSIFAVMVIAGTTSVKAENYLVNDEAVEASFTAAVAAPMSVDFINAIIPNVPAEQSKVAGANGLVAFVLCTLLGTLGVHRFYMGTATLTGVGYILTGGGFGVVVLIDWVVLLISSDISKYENNTKFFMW
jgi:TM2 domain-containing membrane protein YozV